MFVINFVLLFFLLLLLVLFLTGSAPGMLQPPSLVDMVAAATLDVYTSLSKHLRPTPIAPHYVFSSRDVGKMLEGIKLATTGAGDDPIYSKKDVVIRLWAHEVMRVFHDRLVSDEDRMWLLQLIKKTTENRFESDFNLLLAHLDTDGDGQIDEDELLSLHFCSLANSTEENKREQEDEQAAMDAVNLLAASTTGKTKSMETSAGAFGMAAAIAKKKAKKEKENLEKIKRGELIEEDGNKLQNAAIIAIGEELDTLHSGNAYRERVNPETLLDLLSSKSEEYDTASRTKNKRPMKLVVFHYAVEHLCRILRVLDLEGERERGVAERFTKWRE